MLLSINGPLLNSDKPIKIKKHKSSKNSVLLAFKLEKSGAKIFLIKKNSAVKPAKIPKAAIEIGIKNTIP
ncbi:MAG: hypothetical protein BWY16_00216 [Candidatus Omnitrophica bacterium ADurb.Bin205]|nr:MAG: hypothetical protein BWY16_00216 [Candidatus Omnitrophica bacterium ADurb.Bin205]